MEFLYYGVDFGAGFKSVGYKLGFSLGRADKVRTWYLCREA